MSVWHNPLARAARTMIGKRFCEISAAGLLVILISILGFAGMDQCSTPAECNTLGTKVLKDGRADDAITVFLREVFLAESTGAQNEAVLLAYNNLALAHLRKGEDLPALAWTKLALGKDGKNKAALYHLKILKERLKAQRKQDGVTGSFQSYAGLGVWNTLTISEASDESFYFSLKAYRVGSSTKEAYVKSEGAAEGHAALKGRKAVYVTTNPIPGIDTKPCKIKMRFVELAIKVDQEGSSIDCGFGANVDVGGEYWKVSN